MKIKDIIGTEVKIEITSIEDDEIEATIIEVNPFWSSRLRQEVLQRRFYVKQQLFEIGLKLVFHKPANSWIIKNHTKLPWFILNPKNKTFEHYR